MGLFSINIIVTMTSKDRHFRVPETILGQAFRSGRKLREQTNNIGTLRSLIFLF